MTGDEAKGALSSATQVPDAKAFVRLAQGPLVRRLAQNGLGRAMRRFAELKVNAPPAKCPRPTALSVAIRLRRRGTRRPGIEGPPGPRIPHGLWELFGSGSLGRTGTARKLRPAQSPNPRFAAKTRAHALHARPTCPVRCRRPDPATDRSGLPYPGRRHGPLHRGLPGARRHRRSVASSAFHVRHGPGSGPGTHDRHGRRGADLRHFRQRAHGHPRLVGQPGHGAGRLPDGQEGRSRARAVRRLRLVALRRACRRGLPDASSSLSRAPSCWSSARPNF